MNRGVVGRQLFERAGDQRGKSKYVSMAWAAVIAVKSPSLSVASPVGVSMCVACLAAEIRSEPIVAVNRTGASAMFQTRIAIPAVLMPSSAGFKLQRSTLGWLIVNRPYNAPG